MQFPSTNWWFTQSPDHTLNSSALTTPYVHMYGSLISMLYHYQGKATCNVSAAKPEAKAKSKEHYLLCGHTSWSWLS